MTKADKVRKKKYPR